MDNRLYTISYYENAGLYEYTLNHSEYNKKKLDFTNTGTVTTIEKIDEENIFDIRIFLSNVTYNIVYILVIFGYERMSNCFFITYITVTIMFKF